MDNYSIPLILFVLGIGISLMGIKKRKVAKKIQDTPRSKISSAAQGHVEIQGFAWPKTKLTVDSDEKKCIYYSFTLQHEETQGSGKNKRKVWVTDFTSYFGESFYVMDSTGILEVMPIGATLEIESARTRQWSFLSKKQKEKICLDLVNRPIAGFPPSSGFGGLFSKKFRIIEQNILVGSPIYLNGNFRSHTGEPSKVQSPGMTAFYNRLFNKENRSDKNINAFLDKNKDGKISIKEMREGYYIAAISALAKVGNKDFPEESFDSYGEMSTSENHQLIIADMHESHLLRKLNRAVLLIILGLFLILSSIIVLKHLHDLETNSYSQNEANLEAERTVIDNLRITKLKSQINSWHFSCTNNQLIDCQNLIRAHKEVPFSDVNLKYYKAQACKLGDAVFCVNN
jgi:hypothetical protein